MPNILRDGDVITFGKSVGKGSYLVPPVTSRVELSFDSHVPDPSPLPRNIPDATQSNGNSKVHKPSTNRYGLVPSLSSAGSSSPSSDDDGSSRYDHDSDVEEIPQASFNAERVHNTLNSSVVLPTLKAIQAQLVGSALGANEYPGPSLDDVRLPAIEKVISIPRSHSPREVSTSPVEREFSFTSFFKSCNLEPYTLRDLESIGRTSEPNQSFVQVSRSPSPPSEFDLQGREKEAHVNMTEVNTAISDMEVGSFLLDLLIRLTIPNIQSGIASTTANQGSSSANTPSCGVDLEDCVAGTGSMSSSLNDRLDVTQDHVLDLQQHVTKLQEQADSLTPMLRDSAAETLAEVKAGVVSLRDLMTSKFASTSRKRDRADVFLFPEMSGFHQEMEKQLVAELTSVEEARAALVAATSEAQTASRKRRRSEVDEDEASSSNFDKSIVHTHDCIHPPAKKRAKRIVSSLIHTATAVTVGAIATWTALAFS